MTSDDSGARNPTREPGEAPRVRCVAVVDDTLPPGRAANAVGILSITLGALLPELAGPDLVHADDEVLPGLIPQGITVLAAPRALLGDLRSKARASELGFIAMPVFGHETNDYEEVRRRVAELPAGEVHYLGVILYGDPRAVRKLTGSLPLLR